MEKRKSNEKKRKASKSPQTQEMTKKQRREMQHIDKETVLGKKLGDRYIVIKYLSDGTFGRVFEAWDELKQCRRAIKMIKPVQKYIESAKIEADILKDIQLKGSELNNIVSLIDDFGYSNTYCLVFELLGEDLYQFIEQNNHQGLEIQKIQSISRQLLKAVNFLHQHSITHTDLKLENILFVNSEYEHLPYNDIKNATAETQESEQITPTSKNDSEASANQPQKDYKIVPKNSEIKLIDFGSATYSWDHHTSVINTRQYRAPEVILGTGWGSKSDIWSVGCILYELKTGQLMFPTRHNYEHISMMIKYFGQFPKWMIKYGSRDRAKWFTRDFKFKWPEFAESQRSVQKVENLKSIREAINCPELEDLIKKLLKYDPEQRMTAEQALKHPFFQQWYGGDF